MKFDKFMEAIDGMITISEKEPYLKLHLVNMLRDIIKQMAEKMFK